MIAVRLNIFDHPISDIKTHRAPVPYLGGLAIFFSFIIALSIVRFSTHFPTGTLRNLRGLFFGGTIIILLGLADDLKDLNVGLKFIGQIIAAIILVYFDIRIKFIQNPYISIPLTIIWIVGITNAFNIIDIMDGLSVGVAILASLAFSFIALPTENIYVNFASLTLAGACLGFIRYNWTPAKIFMGDTGSLFIGFILAAISLGESYTRINNLALFAPLLVLGIPIYDTLIVIFFRIRKGKSVFKGSRDHIALRLEMAGVPREKVVTIICLASWCLGLVAFSITLVNFEFAAIIYAVTIFVAIIFANRLGLIEVD